MIAASVFSFAYILAPVYMISSLLFLLFFFGKYSILYAVPLFISIIVPPIQMTWLLKTKFFSAMCDYFDYEEIFEISDEDMVKKAAEFKAAKRSFIFTGTPHGILSYGGMCAGCKADKRFNLVTAAAGAVLATPVIKHVVGLFGLIDASAKSLKKQLSKGGIEGSVVLYTGGIAELFKCSDTEEILYLNERKGFIKLALREGADIVPMYFFGNTSVLSIPKIPFLETISRTLQVSLTIFWGRWCLPIPRQHKVLYVRGKPLDLPRIENPTDEDVNKWHKKYIEEVTRLFETYKKKVPLYKDKKLIIV